jgi:hypothetical protein
MDTPTPPRDIFDRRRRAMRRARRTEVPGYFDHHIAAMLLERLDDVARNFSNALIIGARNTDLITAIRLRCTRLSIVESTAEIAQPESYDLILWPGGLESVNDVPGALLRCRFALKPDGLLLGCVIGDGSFPKLRSAMATADAPIATARMHPQLSLQAVGDLLHKIGLALIVTDVEQLSLSYTTLYALVRDMRDAALGNVLSGPVHPISRAGLARASAAFCGDGGGRSLETVRIIHFSGWAPDSTQPQPARRGSATASLAQALRPSRPE